MSDALMDLVKFVRAHVVSDMVILDRDFVGSCLVRMTTPEPSSRPLVSFRLRIGTTPTSFLRLTFIDTPQRLAVSLWRVGLERAFRT
jgi:hypothetical protein